jgi:pimeloyl-ACP methyl ester carboxylesterase
MRPPADYARAVVRSMGTCPGFDATLTATLPRRFLAAAPIDAPVTVAFGSRDLVLLPHQSRHLDQLPPGTRLETLPGCGHIPWPTTPAPSPPSSGDPRPAPARLLRRPRRQQPCSPAKGGGCDSSLLWG